MDEVYKVLVVEDISEDAELIEREIVKVLKSCIFERVWTKKGFIRLLADFQPKMIVSDYYMPGFDGLTALKIAREKMPDIPFIIVTGTLNEDIAVECMRSGASDYVIKEYIKRLGPSILNALEQYAVKIEKNNTQTALIESAERHRSLFEDNIAVMLLLDAHTGDILSIDKRQEFTDIISLSSEQLLSIITDIIRVATLEAGQERIHKKEIDINQTIAAVYEQFCIKSLYPNITIQYHSDIPGNAARIVTDGVKLIQILTNLVGNALKYTREGRVEFSCAIKNNELYFRIEDTGIGIPKHLHQKIFDRFWQVDSTVTREFGGTGLGLSISKAYVELMSGRIWLDSEPGIGSVFHFTLPYEPVIKSKQTDSDEIEKALDESLSKKVILIAEDEINNFLLVREYLSKSVFTVIRVENGLDAVNICKNRKDIDIILMDIKMPVMDGIEATRQIKIMKPEIPVIAVTSYAYDTDKTRLLESGFDEYLPKPLKRESLLKMINQFI